MNKRRIIIISAILLVLSFVLISCGDVKPLFEQKTPEIEKNEFVQVDKEMTIDALANEEVYNGQDKISFTETMSGITCTSKAFLGESGIYLFAYVDDPNVYVSSERQFFENDSVEFYLDPNPAHSKSLESLRQENQVRSDCVQIRINALGDLQTWYGRRIGGSGTYPWTPGYFDTVVSAKVNGEINEQNGAEGYSVEAFIPYYEMNLTSKPEEIGLLVAFNNIDNREDTARTWFSYKGMGHHKLTSYIPVRETGFVVNNYTSVKELTANYDDEFYGNTNEVVMYQVDENNENKTERASFKFVLGEDGLYLSALVKDRVYSYAYDGIFSNDGIEILVDTRSGIHDTIFENGVYRFSYDIAGGCQTDICMNDFNDYVPIFNPTLVKTKVEEYKEESYFKYKYQYTYEAMIPYEVLGLSSKPEKLDVAFAVKTPNEIAYILNRRDRENNLEGQDWLWIDKHYPQNPSEYYLLTEEGISVGTYNDFDFGWDNVIDLGVSSECPSRYEYRGYAASNGLYINMKQYVDNYSVGGVDGDWLTNTHVEMEIWNHSIGYGWDGTYFAFFIDGSYYVNNNKNIYEVETKVTVNEREDSEFLYEISYEIYIGFANNIENPADGPYGYVKMMSHTPNETIEGYENASIITKDGNRMLWTDDCNSYGFNKYGIFTSDKVIASTNTNEFEVVSGDYRILNDKLLFTEFDSLVLLNDKPTGNVTLNAKIFANSNMPTGIVFDYIDGNYYFFGIDGTKHEAVLCKVVDGNVQLLRSNYISASYKYGNAFDISVGIADGKYYCTFFNTLYFVGDLDNNSKQFGFYSEVPGAQFYDIHLENSVADIDVDTLIIGHSYTELWTNYKADFESIGLGENILNIGISGSHSIHWNNLEEEILTYSPELLVYNIGVNDLFFNSATTQGIANNIKELLLNLKNKKADLEVVLISLNHCVTSGHITRQIIETNQYLRQLCDEYDWIKYVDVEDAFRNTNGEAIDSLFTDGLHPTASAYKDIFIPKIAEALDINTVNDLLEQEWDKYVTDVKTSAPTRYQVISHTSADGLYIKVEQYVNNYIIKEDPSDWNSTHVEMELWNHCIGYGFDGTYFAFFANGTFYINNWNNCNGVYNDVKITENSLDSTYRYTITYNIYIAFANNLDNPQDDSYAYSKFMFYTPGEDNSGYENATTITKDNQRTLWTDRCNSYEIHSQGIVKKDGEW